MGVAHHEGMARRGERVERPSGAAPSLNHAGRLPRSESLDGSPLAISIEGAGANDCVIELSGELDLDTVPKLESPLLKALREHDCVVLDLSRLTFIDSSGLGLLIKAHRETAESGNLHTVISRDSQIERVFEVTGIDRALAVFLDREQALAALGAAPAASSRGRPGWAGAARSASSAVPPGPGPRCRWQ